MLGRAVSIAHRVSISLLVDLSVQIVEIGAGAGHWQRELTKLGADIIAYENGEEIPLPQRVLVGDVKTGDQRMSAKHSDRTLFLCYPPQTEMAFESARLVRPQPLCIPASTFLQFLLCSFAHEIRSTS